MKPQRTMLSSSVTNHIQLGITLNISRVFQTMDRYVTQRKNKNHVESEITGLHCHEGDWRKKKFALYTFQMEVTFALKYLVM